MNSAGEGNLVLEITNGDNSMETSMTSTQEMREPEQTVAPRVVSVQNYVLTDGVVEIGLVFGPTSDIYELVTRPELNAALNPLHRVVATAEVQQETTGRNATSLLLVQCLAPNLQNSAQTETVGKDLWANRAWALANLGLSVQVGAISCFTAQPVVATFFTMVLFVSVLLALVVLGTRPLYPASVCRWLLFASSVLAVLAGGIKPFLTEK